MKFTSMTRLKIVMAVIAASLVAAAPWAHAAIVVGTDTATPVWNLPDTGGFTCTHVAYPGKSYCSFTETTITTGTNCSQEVIDIAGTNPALVYSNTPCAATVTVKLFQGGVVAPYPSHCPMVGAADVTFSSGVDSVFNGTFHGQTAFSPTKTRTDSQQNVLATQGIVTVSGGSQMDGFSLNTGSVSAHFQVNLGSGLDTCTAGIASAGSVVRVLDGTITSTVL